MIKPQPFELNHAETTEAEFRDAVAHGGWVEYYTSCPLCDLHTVHRHYICGKCGQIDFINEESCFGCWQAKELWRIRRDLYDFLRKHGRTMQRLGVKFFTALLLLTLAGWRLG